jgi:hypothetical protein
VYATSLSPFTTCPFPRKSLHIKINHPTISIFYTPYFVLKKVQNLSQEKVMEDDATAMQT